MVSKSDLRDEKMWMECPSWRGTSIIQDHHREFLVCKSCGYVIEKEIIDMGPEWRAFSQEQREERSRSGSPMTYTIHDKGLSTQISWKNVDAHGKELSPKRRSQMYRLRKLQRRARISDAMERNLAFALSEMGRMASQLGLSRNVREEASVLYRRAAREKVTRGRLIESVVAAVLYITCRKFGIPQTLKEISEVSRTNKRKIGRTYRALSRKLDTSIPLADPVSFVGKFCSELKLSNKTQSKAIELLKKAKKKHLTVGYNPPGIAAAAIYIATRINEEERPQTKMAEVAKITEVTVRNRYKKLCKELDIKLPNLHYSSIPSEKYKNSIIKVKDTEIQNVVVSVTWSDTTLDLEKLSETLESSEYNPEKFPGLVYRPCDSSVTFLIFSSGKANCVGGKGVEETEEAIKKLTERIKSSGVSIDSNPETIVQNIVVKTDFGTEVNLDKLHESGATTEYNPEMFPGLTLRFKEGLGDALIFQSGQTVFHVQQKKDIEKVTSKIAGVLEKVMT